MKRQNKLVKILLVIFIVCAVVGVIWYKYATRQVYVPDIPNSYNLHSIAIESDTGINTTSDEAEMEEILNGLYDLGLKTQGESIQDYPIDVDDLVAIRFNYREDSVGTLYVYTKNGKYYLEEPYNGVYKLEENEYNYIMNLVD